MKQTVGMRNKCSVHTVFLLTLKLDSSLAVKDKLFFQAILLEPLIPQSPRCVRANKVYASLLRPHLFQGKLNHRPVRDNLMKKKTFGKRLDGGQLGVPASRLERPASCPEQAARRFTK